MTRSLLSSLVAMILLLVVALSAGTGGPGSWPVWIVGLVSGLAYVVGAWCAPLFQSGSPFGGTWFGAWRRGWDSPKSVQILAGALAAAALALLNIFPGASSAILGIVVAGAVGILLPVPGDGRESEDARSA